MRKNKLNHLFSIIIALSWMIGLVAPTSALAAPAQVVEQAAPSLPPELTPTVEAELQQQIAVNPQVGYLIYFRDKADLASAARMSWADKGLFVMDALKSTAENSQANVIAYLDANHVQYKPFWIDNIIAVEASDLNTFNGLLNFGEIETLRARRTEYLIDPQVVPATEALTTVEPNIAHVKAPEVWALGVNGSGMVVSSIDTGVRYTHNALVGKYRGNLGGGLFDHDYNWFDPYGDHPTSPGDDNGHGSHTMGTMLGDDGGANQIGMAPGAEWMACRGCNTSSCTDTALLECAEFIAAPTDLDGDNPDPTKRPNAVNNSWGDCGRAYDPWYQGVVNSWHAGGIYPIFSNGNSSNCGYTSPPPLNTVGNPARYGNVTGVGASGQSNGQYATFSNWGPTDNPDTVNPNPDDAFGAALKPQVLAPGSNIRSSVNTSDTAYEGGWSGTSMSAPHVTGLVALMWSAAPCLVGDYATTENIIENTATPIPYNTGGTPPPPAGNVLNYATGHGEINALAAVTEALGSCGDSTLSGTVTDDVTTDPIEGALV
ncbi:MAG TPA: S8 family serine peptidase, partial [Anaerolineales bacterium]